jgi:hypothetical protein
MILDRQLLNCFTVSTVQTVCLSHVGWIWSLDVNAGHKQFVKNALKSCNWKGSTTVQHPQHLRKEGRDKSNVLPSFWSGSTCLCQQFRAYSYNAACTHPKNRIQKIFILQMRCCMYKPQASNSWISIKSNCSHYLSLMWSSEWSLPLKFSKTWNPRLFSVLWKIFKNLKPKGSCFLKIRFVT